MATVFANSRSIVHSGDGQVNTAAPPDVCKTPSPGGPVPIPYVNVAKDGDLAKGAKKVKIEGNPVGKESSNLSTSTGDEPGTAGGGVMSSKFKGKMTWGGASSDVKAEGDGVVRFMDVAQHNGNSFNTVFTEMGGTGLAYGDDFTGTCGICGEGPREHRVIEQESWQELAFLLRDQLTRVDDGVRDAIARGAKGVQRVAIKNKGYMVGTMHCLGASGRDFAAKSGPNHKPFNTVATECGYTPIASGPATADEMMAASPLCNEGGAAGAAAQATFRARWRMLEERSGMVPGIPQRDGGYREPGNCAAAKLLAKSGHKPRTMTEFFWNPTTHVPAWSATYRVLTTNAAKGPHTPEWRERLLQNREAARPRTPQDFEGGQSVASCHTCQRLLFMLLCKKDERPCG
jgi:hypothetical protein